LLQIKLTSPPEGASYTVPYSQTLGGYVSTNVPFKVEVTSPDGAERYPTEVRYKVDGVRVGASTSAPNFEFNLDITDVFTPAGGTLKQNFTVSAEAKDPYLGQTIQSDEANVEVTWGEEQLTFIEKVTNWLNDYWWLLLILVILVVGLIVLLVLLLRTQSKIGNMAQQAVSSTTQALKGVTKQLSGASKRAPGKLVILQGANVGKEFRLATQMVKVGRDPQFCDFALYDEYASNPHFSIQMEQNKFFITDEGSTNGTRLNGRPLQPQQRVPLQPDAIIEVGQTRLQFKRLGGTTRQIGQRQPSAGAGGQAGAPQQQRGGPTKKVP
jgi:pSer/pThr/pTyr-binding forkhead associated (FHA) protein